MGKRYNDFLEEMKKEYQKGDNSSIWEMVRDIRAVPIGNGLLICGKYAHGRVNVLCVTVRGRNLYL